MADTPYGGEEGATPPHIRREEYSNPFDPTQYSAEELRARNEIGAQAVDMSATLAASMGSFADLLDRVSANAREFGTIFASSDEAIQRTVGSMGQLQVATEKSKAGAEGITSANWEQYEAQSKMFDIQKGRIEAENRWQESLRKGRDELSKQAEVFGMYSSKREQFMIPGAPGEQAQPVSEERFREIMQNKQGEEYQRIMDVSSVRESRRISKDERSPEFRTKEFISALMRGDIGSALGEATQQLGRGERLEQWGAERAAQGGARGMAGRAAMGLGTLARPAVLLGAQQILTRVNRQQQETLALGQITGEGRNAGIQARGDIAQMAINPFDMLSRREARQIVEGVRGQGFKGEFASAMSDAIGDVVQDLGTDVGETLQLATTSIRGAGMSIEGFRNMMEDLDDTAKRSNASIRELSTAIAAAQQEAVGMGTIAAETVAPNIAALTEQFAGARLRPEQAGTLFTDDARRQLGARMGFRPDQVFGEDFSRNIQLYINQALLQLARAGEQSGMPLEDYLRVLKQVPQLLGPFANIDVPVLAGMLRKVWRTTRQGTQPERLVREAREGQVKSARAQFETATDVFRGRTEEGDRVHRAVRNYLGRWGIQPEETIERREIRGVEGGRMIRSIGQAVRDAGLSDEARERIQAPLREVHFGSGDRREWAAAQRESKMLFENEVRVNVQVDPRAMGVFSANYTAHQQSLRGHIGRQGVVMPPIPGRG